MKRNVAILLAVFATLVGPGSDLHARAAAELAQAQVPSIEARRPEDITKGKRVAEGHLKFLYAVYFAIKGCTEASAQLGKDEYRPSVNLDEARATVMRAEAAGRQVGLDLAGAWRQASPVGQITAESLKADTPVNLDRCKRTGRYFRSIVSQLQLALNELGSQESILQRDF